MKIAVLGTGRVGSTIGRLWHAAGHDVTFTARHPARLRALAAELGDRAHPASVADAVAAAEVVLVAVPGPAVTEALQAARPLDGRIIIDAANAFGQQRLSLRSLADAFPRARWERAFNSLSVTVMADDNHREPPILKFGGGLVSTRYAADKEWFADHQITAVNIATLTNPLSSPQGLTKVARMLADGTITTRIHSVIQPDHIGEALGKIRGGGLHGKAVIRLG